MLLKILNKIKPQLKSFNFGFAVFVYLFITLVVSFLFCTLVLEGEEKFCWPPHMLMNGAVVGIAVGMLFVFFLNEIMEKFFSVHMNSFNLHPINSWFVVIVFGFAILMLVIAILYASYRVDLKAMMNKLSAPLLIFSAIASIGGLFFAGSSIKQYRQQITSFSAFAKKLKRMIEETSGDVDEDYVRIMAYTPIPGSLALEERNYNKLKDAMFHEDARLEIVCLNEDALSEWFEKFTKKRSRNGTITPEQINKAKKDIEDLIERVDSPDFSAKCKFAPEHKSKRLSADQLYDFYFFFSDTKAIVAIPFFFPQEPGAVERGDGSIKFATDPVEMIGFETTDFKIIEKIKFFYRSLRD